ncbi:hypothetical protein AK812_SmicGene39983, partial [Symbiodinium microadriaticum]
MPTSASFLLSLVHQRARIDLVRWDARRLPLRAFCADRLLLHPPAGKFFGAPQAHARLYAASLDECRRAGALFWPSAERLLRAAQLREVL